MDKHALFCQDDDLPTAIVALSDGQRQAASPAQQTSLSYNWTPHVLTKGVRVQKGLVHSNACYLCSWRC